MKQFITFVRKESLHIGRDRRTLLILFGMPIVLMVLFGFALTNEVKNSRIAILDHAKDPATEAIVQQLAASQYFEVADYLYSYHEVEAVFKKGQVRLVVVFPPRFYETLLHSNKAQVQLVADASDPNVATTLTNYASAVLADYQRQLAGNRELPYALQTQVRMLYNPQQKGAYSFVPGIMAMVLMLVCTMMTSIAIVKEKETGTMEVLLVSPVQPLMVIVTKAVPYLVLSVVNIVTILLLSVFVLDVPIRGSLLLLFAESILFIITCLSLGLLISTATGSQQTAMLISLMGMFLPTVMFSGFMFPIDNMPVPLQIISNAVPAKWFYYIVKEIMIKGQGIAAIWKETLILLGMTLFLLTVSIRKFNIRLG